VQSERMAGRPAHQLSHLEPRTVPLERHAWHLRAPGLDPEAALIAAQEGQDEDGPGRRPAALMSLCPADALAIDWWLLGLSQREVARWLGVAGSRVNQRISRGLRRLRVAG
jgi:hypothetical protein